MTTPLQKWLVAVTDVLDDARAELGTDHYETLLDILCCRIAREYIARIGELDTSDEASEAA